MYKPAKNYYIDLKHSEYDHMGYLISLRRPTLTCFILTSFVMTYQDHGQPITNKDTDTNTDTDAIPIPIPIPMTIPIPIPFSMAWHCR